MAQIVDLLNSIDPVVLDLQGKIGQLAVMIQEARAAMGGPGFSQEDIDKAVADALAEAKVKADAEKEQAVKDAVAAIPVASPDGKYSQEEMDKFAASKVAEAIAAIPEDTTPYSEEDMGKVKSELEEAKKLASELKANDDQQEADKAKMAGILANIDALLHPVAQPELPVQP